MRILGKGGKLWYVEDLKLVCAGEVAHRGYSAESERQRYPARLMLLTRWRLVGGYPGGGATSRTPILASSWRYGTGRSPTAGDDVPRYLVRKVHVAGHRGRTSGAPAHPTDGRAACVDLFPDRSSEAHAARSFASRFGWPRALEVGGWCGAAQAV